MPPVESVLDSPRMFPMACRACGQVDAVATSLKPAKDAAGKHLVYMLCRACHHRWQDAVTIDTDM